MLTSGVCRLLITALALCAIHPQGLAQFGRGRGRIPPARLATDASFDGSWHLCRLAYQGRGWATDYPDADYNFSTRLSELTKTSVSKKADGEPNPLIVRPADPALFHCPFVMLWQAESLWLGDEDAQRLREYLLKGGFIWADDSWGSYAWENFANEMGKILPLPSKQPDYRANRSHSDFLINLEIERKVLKATLRECWQAKEPLTELPLERIEALAREKYETEEWNLRF